MSHNAPSQAPILSTSDAHILDHVAPVTQLPRSILSDEQVYITYEIDRTVREIRANKWRNVALQFPDHMLVDGPRVYEQLRAGLARERERPQSQSPETIGVTASLADATLDELAQHTPTNVADTQEKLTILGDTSYGACCVDEVAAEHVSADVVVHYGRSCLSPTARLPVIHIFTEQALDQGELVNMFTQSYPDKTSRVVLMADIPYQTHVLPVYNRLQEQGYTSLQYTSVVHDPSAFLPNRVLSADLNTDSSELASYSLFHIADPPPALLLTIASRVASIYICPVSSGHCIPATTVTTSTSRALRRRFAHVTHLSTAGVFGILINTLSVKNYLVALDRLKHLISRAGKKHYTFVVGKLNAAKVANFAEIDGWVVVGCWESSLIDSKDFWKPIITPYELELALTDEKERIWTGEWKGGFSSLLTSMSANDAPDRKPDEDRQSTTIDGAPLEDGDDLESDDEDEPPVFDLRTGRYVSTSRPLARSNRAQARAFAIEASQPSDSTTTSTTLTKRPSGGALTMKENHIRGQLSPAAEFLRSKRTWTGLGSVSADSSDVEYGQIAYERDEDGKIVGAPMLEGRSGLARGYTVGEDESMH